MEYRKLSEIKLLDKNPRKISDSQFKILCDSIQENANYFEARPIILSNRTGKNVIIAGNQRYKAAKHLKLKEVPTYLIEGLTEDKEKELVVRDNISNGEWDWDILNTGEWGSVEELSDWGLDIPIEKEVNTDGLFDIEIPFYEASNIIPNIQELADTTEVNELINKIEKLEIENDLKNILKIRASFFADFNFQKIADFYHHSNEEIKLIFEDLGMVILAPKKALEKGFIEISENIMEL